MADFENKRICSECGAALSEDENGLLFCGSCGYKENEKEYKARLKIEAEQYLSEESTDYRLKSEFEKFTKETEEKAFERGKRVKVKPGEFEETATSQESGKLLIEIKRRQEVAKAKRDEKELKDLLLEEEKVRHEHDRHLAQEARERSKAKRLEAKMPFELIIDTDGFVKMSFGNFPQQLVADERMISVLDEKMLNVKFNRNEQGWFKFGNVTYSSVAAMPRDNAKFSNDEKIEFGKFYYFKVQPILWRVIDVRDDEALLLSDKIIAVKDFNDDLKNGKWSDCYIRDYLNARFFTRAFTADERKWIKQDRLDNVITAHKHTKKFAGEDTEDAVFLLSHADAVKRIYGFSIVSDKRDPERRAEATDYARALGAAVDNGEHEGFSSWWLRSPGSTEKSASSVEFSGRINLLMGVNQKLGIRPVIRIRPFLKKE